MQGVETTDLGEEVQAMTLKHGQFPFPNDPSEVVFVRDCTRKIADRIVECRRNKEKRIAAIVGQPGIGKSYCLFYIAHRFLQEKDVDAVVLESSEKERFHVFYRSGYRQEKHPEMIHEGSLPIVNERNIQLIDSQLLCRESVVYVVDMDVKRKPSIPDRKDLFMVVSSSPRPFKNHIKDTLHKVGGLLFSPPPWEKKEIKVVFDYANQHTEFKLGIQNFVKETGKTFEDYFDLFGGTLRALQFPNEELGRMEQGAKKLVENFGASAILDTLQAGAESASDDYTHSIFSEVGGIDGDQYIVKVIPTKRQFRSSFTHFWFRKYIAPRVLFKDYKEKCLTVLFDIESADAGKRGVSFEDFFHKLLPLGKWNIMDLADDVNEPGPSQVVALYHFFLGAGAWFAKKPAVERSSKGSIDLKDVPVEKRDKDEVNTSPHALDWQGWGDVTLENKLDVCHLVAVWKKRGNKSFYWIPLGKQFPGLDSVYKDGTSDLYFIQVKTGAKAESPNSWIDLAVKISILLYEKLGRPRINCTLLIGCEPVKTAPALGKRKRQALVKDHKELRNWSFKYLAAPYQSDDDKPQKPQDIELDWEILKGVENDFNVFKYLLEEGGKESSEESEDKKPAAKEEAATGH